MLELEISENSKIDIEEIFEYTINFFGQNKADNYSKNLFEQILIIQNKPNIGHLRNDIPFGNLAWTFEQHILIYEIWKDCIYINRILHSKMNFIDQFN